MGIFFFYGDSQNCKMRTLWTIDKVCCVKDSHFFLSFKNDMFTRYFQEKVFLKVPLFPPEFSSSVLGTL